MHKLLLKTSFFLLLFVFFDFFVAISLQNGMGKYYGLNKNARILCVGHSHTVLGIDSKRMEKELSLPVSKYAVAGANVMDRLFMIKHFLELNPNVKTVIYDVDARLFDSDGLSSASYTLFLPFMGIPSIANYLSSQATWQEYYLGKIIKSTRFRDQTLMIAIRGLIGKTEHKKTTTVNIADFESYLSRQQKRAIRINPESVKMFMETVEFLSKKRIKVVLAYIPVIDRLNITDLDNREKVKEIFETIAAHNENVYFWNYNELYEHKYDLFYDPRHLNEIGKQEITRKIINDLKVNGVV